MSLSFYKAFGLTISSEVKIHALRERSLDLNRIDVTIRKEDLNNLWLCRSEENKYFYIKKDIIMFEIPNVAIFLIKNGSEIYVSPHEFSKQDKICLYILGTCMGAILMQRFVFPLHGSAIAIGEKAYAIVGESGAGKSTLASALLKKGYKLLSDDVIPITLNESGVPIVTPAYPQQKLWLESLNQFGMESSKFQPIIDREAKFSVPVESQFASNTMPLGGVFELIKADSGSIELQPINNLRRFQTLFTHTYRQFFVNPLGLMEWHFTSSSKIINHIDLFQLRRPQHEFTAHELADLILSTIKKEVIAHESYSNA